MCFWGKRKLFCIPIKWKPSKNSIRFLFFLQSLPFSMIESVGIAPVVPKKRKESTFFLWTVDLIFWLILSRDTLSRILPGYPGRSLLNDVGTMSSRSSMNASHAQNFSKIFFHPINYSSILKKWSFWIGILIMKISKFSQSIAWVASNLVCLVHIKIVFKHVWILCQ